jgi:hypothetical protein
VRHAPETLPTVGSENAISYVNSLLATGDYPHLAQLADEVGLEQAWSQIEAHLRDTERFARNLSRLLDGIEASLPPH